MLLGRKVQYVNGRQRVPIDYSDWLSKGERVTGIVCTVDHGLATVDTETIDPDGRGASFILDAGTLRDLFNVIVEANTNYGQRRYDTVAFFVETNGGAT